MLDLAYILLAVTLFAVSAAYVRGCAKLTAVGDDTSEETSNGRR